MVIRFGPLDGVVLALFVAGVLALGFSARLRSLSILQFLAAGRALTLPVFVATLVSTWYGGILGIGESVSYYGVGTWALFGLPYYVFAALYAGALARRVRSADQISIPERLELRFGRPVALAGAVLVFLLALPAAHALMLGVLVQSLTGWDLLPSMVVGTAVGTALLYKGGLMADARVSLLSFTLMYVGFAAMVAWCAFRFPLLEPLRSLDRPELLQWDGGAGTLYFVSLFLLGAWTLVDPGFHQRVASAASPEIGRRGVMLSVGLWFCFDLLTITCGLYALTLLSQPPSDPLLLFPALAQAVLPGGLKALFFCGMAGTILSAFVGYTLVAGASLGREVAARLRPSASDLDATRWTRWGLVASALLAVVVGRLIGSVVALWYAWAGAVVGAMLLPVLQAYGIGPFRHVGKHAVLASMAAGFTLSMGWLVYGKTTGNGFLEVGWVSGQGLQFVQPSSPLWPEATKMSLGTLIPGLVAGALVLALGEATARRRHAHAGR